MNIDIIASETGIAGKVIVGDGDDRKIGQVSIQLADLPAKDRQHIERIIRNQIEKK